MSSWIDANWFSLVQTVGICASLWMAASASRGAKRATQVGTLLQITQSHRDLWNYFHDHPELERVLDQDIPEPVAVTPLEAHFVRLLVFHLSAVFEADRRRSVVPVDQMAADVSNLLSRPIPRAVWSQLRPYQNARLVAFIDATVPTSLATTSASYPTTGEAALS